MRQGSGKRGVCLGALSGVFGAACLAAPAFAADDLALRGTSDPEYEPPITCMAHASGCFMLLGVTLDGASVFSHAELSRHYEPYLTREVSLDDLARIADEITARYRERGYFLSRAIVPPQSRESGIARIAILEGRITEVVVEGDGRAQAAPFFRGMDTGAVASLAEVDSRIGLARNVPGLNVRSRVEPDPDEPTRHRLVVSAELARIEAYAQLDNRGADDVGPLQAYGRVAANSILLDRDQAALSVFTTPSTPADFTSVEVSYAYVLENGARLAAAAAASRSHDGQDMASPDAGGDSQSLAIAYQHPLASRRTGSLWLGGAFEARHIEGDWLGGGAYADELRVARITLRGLLNEEGRATTVFARASFGLDVLGASGASILRRSRIDATGEFISLNLHATHYSDLSRYLGVFVSVDGQWSDRPLLLSEEFTMGGAFYGRGYDAGELSGDRALAGLVELRAGYDPNLGPISFVQGYAFYDTAEVWNFDSPGAVDSLASAGAGVRVTFDDWLTARWELAHPLTRTPVEEGERDWRQFFSLSATY